MEGLCEEWGLCCAGKVMCAETSSDAWSAGNAGARSGAMARGLEREQSANAQLPRKAELRWLCAGNAPPW